MTTAIDWCSDSVTVPDHYPEDMWLKSMYTLSFGKWLRKWNGHGGMFHVAGRDGLGVFGIVVVRRGGNGWVFRKFGIHGDLMSTGSTPEAVHVGWWFSRSLPVPPPPPAWESLEGYSKAVKAESISEDLKDQLALGRAAIGSAQEALDGLPHKCTLRRVRYHLRWSGSQLLFQDTDIPELKRKFEALTDAVDWHILAELPDSLDALVSSVRALKTKAEKAKAR